MHSFLILLFILFHPLLMAAIDSQFDARTANLVMPKTLTSNVQKEVSIPRGSIWNFRERGAVVDFDPSALIDSTGKNNFFLGTNLPTNPNSIDTDSTRCFGAANSGMSVVKARNVGVVGSKSGSIAQNGTADIAFVFFEAADRCNAVVNAGAAGGIFVDSIIACERCNLTNDGPQSLNRNSIIASILSNMNVLNGAVRETSVNLIGGCRFCTINDASATMIGGSDNITLNSGVFICAVHGSGSSTLSNACTYSGMFASVNSTINGGTRSALVGANNGALTSATNSVGTGSSPIINSFSNVFSHGATATANNQAIFGTRVDVTGGDLTVSNGAVQTSKGLLTTVRTITGNDTLLAADGAVFLNGNNITLTIPSAASMGANFPLDTSRTWQINAASTFLGNPNKLSLASGSFENNGGFNTYLFSISGEHLDLVLQNTVTPVWQLGNNVSLEANFSAPANSFGLTPPKSDAAQLPTSTSEATHKALTTTSYVTFTTNGTPTYFQLAGGFVQALCTMEGVWSYEIQVNTATGGGNYLIRADLVLTASGNSFAGSYSEQGGVNTVPGTVVIRGKSERTFIDPFSATPVSVRISEDSANLINASASILSVRLYCDFRI